MSGDRSGRQKKEIRVFLDSVLLDPVLPQDEIALENALGVLDGHLKNQATDKESLVLDLMSKQNLFEFVFSALSDEASRAMKQHISNVFPTNALVFLDSLSLSLLERLSQHFWYHNIPATNLADHYRWVQMARSALESMACSSTAEKKKGPFSIAPVETESEGPKSVQGTSQRVWKNMKRDINAVPYVDAKLFSKLDLEPPRTADDVSKIQGQLLYDLKDILMDYLDVLRKPNLAPTFKSSYIAQHAATLPRGEAGAAIIDGESTNSTGPVVAQPAAFANILPLKAALNFDSVEGFGDWHILISTQANKDLRSARRKDPKRFIIYVKKIRELSNGHFSDDNHKKLTGNESDIPVYEAKMTGDSRLVYLIDCIREYGEETERQVIKLFGIYTHAHLKRDTQAWKNVSKQLSGRGSEYRKRVLYRMKPVNSGDKVYAPATFPLNIEHEDLSSSADLRYLRAEEQQDLHERLVLEKFSTFSQAFLNNILAEEDAAHVFHMSPTEQDIVRHVGSCYVYGRSGTGKTTTMIFKMLGIERAHETIRDEYDPDARRPRQLFVTQSGVLAEKVQDFYVKLAIEQAAARRTAKESSKLAVKRHDRDDQGLVDKDEEELHDGTLPRSFSELTDEHFPLFITFDHLCRLLEADQNRARSQATARWNLQDDVDTVEESNDTTEYMLQRRKSFVSYAKFYNEYWPHLPQNLTKNLDPALVFAEIMGVIKGSEESMLTEKGFLSQDAYIKMSHRTQATFSTRREVVYSIFQAYTRRKQEYREWDAADRTHSIIRGLHELGIPGRKVDFIYIDEAQDNLLVDALILRSMCKNSSGLFWAGDTAQTISAGSSFRFEELKAFLFRIERLSTSIPQEFQLAVNYRSHGGIVKAAHSVVQLISRFWPHAIDALAEEKGIIDGARPVFFTGWEEDRSRYERFFFGAPESQIEFGANQCILVRDEAARDELQKQVGDIGTVLTLYESKGLEFNDVLLYNFFQDSTVDVGQWRVILNALPFEEGIKCPVFDDTRHNGVCRELKFLYVAITRARQNLWIADSSEKSEPLRLFWTKQDLVTSISASEDIPRLARASTSQEWAETGKLLFDNKQFSQAVNAFAKAGLAREKGIATAYHHRDLAQRTPQGRNSASDPRRQAFLQAAQTFSHCASVATLAKARLSYFRNSAECYFEALEIKKAAEMYLLAEEHTEAAKIFRRGGMFDEAVDTIDKYAEKIEPEAAEKIRDVAKIHYSLEQNLDRATKLFSDVDKALEFMDDFGFSVARVELLERYGRLCEAAEIHLAEGRTLDAIRMLIRDKANTESRSLLEQTLLKSIWQHISFGVPLRDDDDATRPQLQHLLPLAEEAATYRVLSPKAVDELSLCQAVLNKDTTALHTLVDKFTLKHHDLTLAVLCLDYIFQTWTTVENAKANVVWSALQRFSFYTRVLQQMPFERNLSGDEKLQRLFGFYPNPDATDLVIIPVATLLHQVITACQERYHFRIIEAREDSYVLTSWELPVALKAAIREHLQMRIRDENNACSRASAFRLCPVFIVMGERDSHRRELCRSSHDQQDMTLTALNSRLRMLWQQILIYQWATVFERRNEFAWQRRRWISRLYEAYFPVHYKVGSALDIDLATIKEAEKGVQIVIEWIHDLLLNQDFSRVHDHGFLTFIAELVTLALRFEKSGVLPYFSRAPCITMDCPEGYVRESGRYIVWDLLDFLTRTGTTSLSSGVLFVKHVCERRLPIDVNVLCHIVELLSAAYAIGHRLRVYGSLHGIIMSRRLLSRLHADEALKAQDPRMIWLFVGTICSLLCELNSCPSDFLLYKGLPRGDNLVRRIFIMRICKSFTLLGYNVNNMQLRMAILHQIACFKNLNSRPEFEVKYPSIYERYVNASSWSDLEYAAWSTGAYDKNTPEELIHLHDAGRFHGTPYEVYGARSVAYKTTSDISAFLRGAAKSNPNAAPIREAPRSIHAPSASGDAHVNVGYFQPLTEGEDIADSINAHSKDARVDEEAVSKDRDADLARHAVMAPTADELRAATLFATLYREKMARKRSAIENGAYTEFDQLYRSYQESPFIAQMSKRYRLLFLGPLPLAFQSLRTMASNVATAKSRAKARMAQVSHSEYERIAAQIKQANAIDRQVQQLKKLLDPGSEWHSKSSEAELRVHVQEIAGIASKFPGTIHGRQWELKTAVKGIVQDPAPKKPRSIKVPKPDLVVDLDDYESYD